MSRFRIEHASREWFHFLTTGMRGNEAGCMNEVVSSGVFILNYFKPLTSYSDGVVICQPRRILFYKTVN